MEIGFYNKSSPLCLFAVNTLQWSFDTLKCQPYFSPLYISPVNMEVMPSKSVSNLMIEGRFTKTSRFFQFLIKICFIPVSVKNNKIVFKVFSCKMVVYIFCAVMWNIFTQTMMVMFMKQEDFDRFFSEVSSSLKYLSSSHSPNIA